MNLSLASLEKVQAENLEKDIALLNIAKEEFRVKTLETRNGDSLDFYDVAVWSIKSALEKAYEQGQRSKIIITEKLSNIRDLEQDYVNDTIIGNIEVSFLYIKTQELAIKWLSGNTNNIAKINLSLPSSVGYVIDLLRNNVIELTELKEAYTKALERSSLDMWEFDTNNYYIVAFLNKLSKKYYNN